MFSTGNLRPTSWIPTAGVGHVWSLQLNSSNHKTQIYWIVHGSSLVRATRQQLRWETAPERYERQAAPAHAFNLKKPLAERLLEALKPVRGPVRAVDIAAKAQSPDDFPFLGDQSSADASGDVPLGNLPEPAEKETEKKPKEKESFTLEPLTEEQKAKNLKEWDAELRERIIASEKQKLEEARRINEEQKRKEKKD